MLPGFLRTGKDLPITGSDDDIRARFKHARFQVLTALTLGYGFMYTCRLSINVVKKELVDAGLLTATDLGMIGTAFLWAYGFGKLINGGLADRANIKRFIPFGLFISAIINFMMGTTTVVWICTILWAFNGLFQGIGAPASAVGITQWAPPSRRGTFYSIWSASHVGGEGITNIGTAAVVAYTTWQMGYIAPAIFCVVVSGLLLAFLHDRPRAMGLPAAASLENGSLREENLAKIDDDATSDEVKKAKEEDIKKVKAAQLTVLKHPAIRVVGLASMCMYISRYAINSWGFFYLEKEFGYAKLEAGGILFAASVAGLLGSVLYGIISDFFFKSRRPPVTLLFGLLEVVGVVIIFFGPKWVAPEHRTLILGVGFVIFGFTISGLIAVLGGLFAVDVSPRRAAGFAMGVVGSMSYLGAGMGDLITGRLIDAHTSYRVGIMHNLENVVDFSQPIAFWVGASVLSVVLAATLWKVEVNEE
ncbi:MAG: MFS transporter [Deltaproteobacteria bacterium]|nr:MFS transporter [Deltaproteobacteria bacterium]